MKLCKTAAMKNIQKINRVTEVMKREIRKVMRLKLVHFRGKMMAEKTGSCHCFKYNQSDIVSKSGTEWR